MREVAACQLATGVTHTAPAIAHRAARCATGLLVEKAGGKTSDGVTGKSVLDMEITGIDQRTALCIGSANEVERFNEAVLNK